MGVVRVHDLTHQTSIAAPSDVDVDAELRDRVASLRACVSHRFMAAHVPSVELRTGYEMPAFGLGTWKSAAENEVGNAVREAIAHGYRHVDCAKIYGNEKEIGEALQYCMKYGGVRREEIFITSKLWNADHAAADVREACVESMTDLQLDYLDLYLMHWPETGNVGPVVEPTIKETWLAMEKLVEEGLVRTIGISNFTVKKIEEMLPYCTILPAVNQVELHPFLRQDALVQYCAEKGIHVTAYSPLGTPDSAAIFGRWIAPSVLNDPRVKAVAEKLGKTTGQVLIRWGLHRGTSVLAKSVRPERIKGNLEVFDWELPEEDFRVLSSFEIQFRMLSAEIFLHDEGPYKTLGDLWDDPEENLLKQKYIESLYTKDAPCPKTEISPEVFMPLVGLGTWRSEPNELKEAVVCGVRRGYRHIDCAQIYENEHEVGAALERIFEEGILKREDLWITSKLWNTDHARDRVFTAVKKSLANLKVSYLDLYLIHWPITGNVGPEVIPSIQETWQAMEELVEQGLVRCIGVSNFSIKKLDQILSYTKIQPAVCQAEIHAYHRNDALIQWCRYRDIHVTAYSPLGGAPENEQLVKKTLPKLLENDVVEEVAQRIGKSKGQVLIRWALQHGTSVLPKSVRPERIEMNYDLFDWELSVADYEALSQLKPQTRMLDGSWFLNPQGPFKTVSDIWDE